MRVLNIVSHLGRGGGWKGVDYKAIYRRTVLCPTQCSYAPATTQPTFLTTQGELTTTSRENNADILYF